MISSFQLCLSILLEINFLEIDFILQELYLLVFFFFFSGYIEI